MKHPPKRFAQDAKETDRSSDNFPPKNGQPKASKGCYHSPWLPKQDAGDLVDFLAWLFWDKIRRCRGDVGLDPSIFLTLVQRNLAGKGILDPKRGLLSLGITVSKDKSLTYSDNMGIVAITQCGWRIEAGVLGDGKTGWISCAERKNADAPNDTTWEMQDTKDVSPSEVTIKIRKGRVFLAKETHYRCGLTWDPGPGVCAENAYREDGGIRWRARRVDGKLNGRGRPCFESFWANNIPMIVEYGSQGRGKHREIVNGGAYQEFFPNGKLALLTYALNGKLAIGPAGFCEAKYNGEGAELERKTKEGDAEAISCSTSWAISFSGFCRRHPDVYKKFPQQLELV